MKKAVWFKWLERLILVTPVVVVFWLAWEYSAIDGALHARYTFRPKEPVFQPLQPLGRVSNLEKDASTGLYQQRILGEPVYLPVTIPRSYDEVDVTVRYRNPDQRVMDMGIVLSETPFTFRLHPFDYAVLNEVAASTEWSAVSSGETTLFQRIPTRYESVEAFESDLPIDSRVGTVHYAPVYEFRIPEYQPRPGGATISESIRGSQSFLTYVGEGESLQATLEFEDTNATEGNDSVLIELRHNGEAFYETGTDDTIDEETDTSSDMQVIDIDVPGLDEGVYEILIRTSDDVFMRSLTTEQDYLVAKGRVALSTPESVQALERRETNVYANPNQLTAVALGPEWAQQVRIGDEELFVEEEGRPFTWHRTQRVAAATVTPVQVEAGHIRLITDGYIAFEEDAFFDPDYDFAVVDEYSTVSNYDFFVATNYMPPRNLNTGKEQQLTISLEGVAGDRKELEFMISASGIDENHYQVTIDSIDMVFRRAPLWERLKTGFAFLEFLIS